jgi:hypothetical protein
MAEVRHESPLFFHCPRSTWSYRQMRTQQTRSRRSVRFISPGKYSFCMNTNTRLGIQNTFWRTQNPNICLSGRTSSVLSNVSRSDISTQRLPPLIASRELTGCYGTQVPDFFPFLRDLRSEPLVSRNHNFDVVTSHVWPSFLGATPWRAFVDRAPSKRRLG